MSARKFLDAAQQTGDQMLFYTVFRCFQQRNQRLRGSPSFNPGEEQRPEQREDRLRAPLTCVCVCV